VQNPDPVTAKQSLTVEPNSYITNTKSLLTALITRALVQ